MISDGALIAIGANVIAWAAAAGAVAAQLRSINATLARGQSRMDHIEERQERQGNDIAAVRAACEVRHSK